MLKNVKIIADYPFKLLLLTEGKIKYINKKMGTYRCVRNSGTSFSAIVKNDEDEFTYDAIYYLENLINMDTDYKELFSRKLMEYENAMVKKYIVKRKFKTLKEFFNARLKDKSASYKINMVICLFTQYSEKVIHKITKKV